MLEFLKWYVAFWGSLGVLILLAAALGVRVRIGPGIRRRSAINCTEATTPVEGVKEEVGGKE